MATILVFFFSSGSAAGCYGACVGEGEVSRTNWRCAPCPQHINRPPLPGYYQQTIIRGARNVAGAVEKVAVCFIWGKCRYLRAFVKNHVALHPLTGTAPAREHQETEPVPWHSCSCCTPIHRVCYGSFKICGARHVTHWCITRRAGERRGESVLEHQTEIQTFSTAAMYLKYVCMVYVMRSEASLPAR